MNQKKLTKTFMRFSNWKKTFDLHGLYIQYFSVVRVKYQFSICESCLILNNIYIAICSAPFSSAQRHSQSWADIRRAIGDTYMYEAMLCSNRSEIFRKNNCEILCVYRLHVSLAVKGYKPLNTIGFPRNQVIVINKTSRDSSQIWNLREKHKA